MAAFDPCLVVDTDVIRVNEIIRMMTMQISIPGKKEKLVELTIIDTKDTKHFVYSTVSGMQKILTRIKTNNFYEQKMQTVEQDLCMQGYIFDRLKCIILHILQLSDAEFGHHPLIDIETLVPLFWTELFDDKLLEAFKKECLKTPNNLERRKQTYKEYMEKNVLSLRTSDKSSDAQVNPMQESKEPENSNGQDVVKVFTELNKQASEHDPQLQSNDIESHDVYYEKFTPEVQSLLRRRKT